MMATKAPNPIDKHVGARVRMRRLLVGMSQEKLGTALGVSFQQVQKYEKGTNRIGAGRLQEIAKILKVPVSFFFSNGNGGSSGGDDTFSLLETAYSLRLMKAFARIASRNIQRSTVELVEQIADAAGSPRTKM